MKKVALLGAGGKIGIKAAPKLNQIDEYDLRCVEINEKAIQLLKEAGINTMYSMEEAVNGADMVVLAVPDVSVKEMSAKVIPMMKEGSMIVGLDPAAAYAGVMYERDGINYFVSHPHHPALFLDTIDKNELNDYFGGIAPQDISCSLYKGDTSAYADGEKLARDIYAPVDKAFNVTIEQMCICEPALVESISSTLISAIKDAYDAAVDLGADKDACYSFLMGHLRVQMAIAFGLGNFKIISSAGAQQIEKEGKKIIFKESWLDSIMNKENLLQSCKCITNSL